MRFLILCGINGLNGSIDTTPNSIQDKNISKPQDDKKNLDLPQIKEDVNDEIGHFFADVGRKLGTDDGADEKKSAMFKLMFQKLAVKLSEKVSANNKEGEEDTLKQKILKKALKYGLGLYFLDFADILRKPDYRSQGTKDTIEKFFNDTDMQLWEHSEDLIEKHNFPFELLETIEIGKYLMIQLFSAFINTNHLQNDSEIKSIQFYGNSDRDQKNVANDVRSTMKIIGHLMQMVETCRVNHIGNKDLLSRSFTEVKAITKLLYNLHQPSNVINLILGPYIEAGPNLDEKSSSNFFNMDSIHCICEVPEEAEAPKKKKKQHKKKKHHKDGEESEESENEEPTTRVAQDQLEFLEGLRTCIFPADGYEEPELESTPDDIEQIQRKKGSSTSLIFSLFYLLI